MLRIFVSTSLITAIISLFTTLFIFIKSKERIEKRIFSLFSLSIFIWSSGLSLEVISPTREIALFWSRFLHMGVNFITPTYLHICLILAELDNKKKGIIIISYFCAFLLSFSNFSSLLVKDVTQKFYFNYYTVPGILYPFLLLLFFGCMGYGFFILLKAQKNATDNKRTQIKYFLIGSVLGYIGGTPTYLPVSNIFCPPHTMFLLPIYYFFLAYAIIRHHLLEIEVVVRRTIVFTGVFTFVFGAFVGTAYLAQTFWAQITGSEYLAMAIAVLIIVLVQEPLKNMLIKYTDRFFLQKKYDYQKVLRDASEGMSTVRESKWLLGLITHILSSKMRLSNIGIFLQKDKLNTEHYSLKARRGKETIQPEAINKDNPISLWLKDNKKPLVLEEVDYLLQRKDGSADNSSLKNMLTRIKSQMQSLNSKVIIPTFYKGSLLGFLSLGYKLSGDMYTKEDLILLSTLSSSAAVAIENTFLVKEMVEQERLKQELELGRDIQMNLLPKELPKLPTLTVDGLMLPAKEIGGDYYDFITLPEEDGLAIVIGDVSGKGVAAGLLMAMAKTAIHTLSQENTSPREVLLRTNSILYSQIGGQKFMTMLYFIYKPKEKTLYYSSAGHEHILIYHNSSNSIEAVMSGGFMLGMLLDIESYLEEHKIILEPKDKVLLYTDGVTEAESPTGDRFGLERLINSFKDYSKKNASELLQTIKDQVYEFMNTQPQYDDITLVVMEEGG